MSGARLSVIMLLAAALAAAGGGPAAGAWRWPWQAEAGPGDTGPRPVVSEILAETEPAPRSVPGVIGAEKQVTLAFQTLGRLISRDVDVGDRVAQGDSLARQDPDDLAGNIHAAEAGLEAAQVQLATAESTAARTRELARRKVASQARLEAAEQALAAAQAAADQAQSELIRARDAAGFAEILAPFSGIVSAVYENPGAVVAAGAPVLQLSAGDRREALIDLPESAVETLPADARFLIWQEGAPERRSEAVVDRIDPMADRATRTRRLHLSLEQGDDFRLGALIRAEPLAGPDHSLNLPAVAIVMREDRPHVWVVDRAEGAEQGTVRLVPIETGAEIDGRVTVAAGLSPSDEVVIRGAGSLTEGQAVGRRVAP